MNTKAQRNVNLDLMRVLACIAVVGLHTARLDGSMLGSVVYCLCGFAVPAFFMTSGYTLLTRKRLPKGYVLGKIAGVMRLAVVWPWVMWLANAAVGLIVQGEPLQRLSDVPAQIVTNFLQHGNLWQFWYLGATMLLYACLPLLYRLREKGWLGRLWACLVVAGVAVVAASSFLGRPIQAQLPQMFRLWTWLQYFVLGGLLGSGAPPRPLRRLQGVSMKAHTLLLLAATAWIVVYLEWMRWNVLRTPAKEWIYDSIFAVLWVVALFTWVMKLRIPRFLQTAIPRLASLTLGVYILHPSVLMLVAHVYRRFQIPVTLLTCLLVLLLSVLIAYVMSRIPFARGLIRFDRVNLRRKAKNPSADA